MSEEIQNTEESAPPIQHISGGDAVVVIALLTFIVVWVGGWIWGLSKDPPSEDIKWWVAVIILFIIAGPAVWASGMIKSIVTKER